jgi:chromosome segregation ATPase
LVEQALEADPLVQARRQEVTRLEPLVQRGPAVPEKQRELRDAKAALAKRLAEARDKVLARLRKREQSEAAASRAEIEELVKMLEAENADMQRKVEQQKQLVQNIGKSVLELEMKRAEIDQAEATIKLVRAEKERLKVELQSTPRRITQVHEAEVPNTKDIGTPILRAAAIGFWGLLIGSFGAVGMVCLEHLNGRVRGGNDRL